MYDKEITLEVLRYAFDEACDNGRIEDARKVITEVRDIAPSSAKVLEAELLAKPLAAFLHESHELQSDKLQ